MVAVLLSPPAFASKAASPTEDLTAGQVISALAVAEGSFAFGTLAGWWVGFGAAGPDCFLHGFPEALLGGAIGGLLLPPLMLELWGDVNDHDGSGLLAAFGIVTGALLSVAIAKTVPEDIAFDVFGTSLFILPGLLGGGAYLTTGPVRIGKSTGAGLTVHW